MKKTMLLAITLSAIFCSCESDGPKSRLYEDTRTSDELFQDGIDAGEGNGWLYRYDTDVFYLVDGEWRCYG